MVQVERVKGELPGSVGAWRVTTYAQTKAEAFAKAAKIEEVTPEAFIPVEVHHAIEAPMVPIIEFVDDENLGLNHADMLP